MRESDWQMQSCLPVSKKKKSRRWRFQKNEVWRVERDSAVRTPRRQQQAQKKNCGLLAPSRGAVQTHSFARPPCEQPFLPSFPRMSIAAVSTSRQAWRHGRAILLQHVEHCRTGTSSSRALSSAAAAADDGDSRLGALRKKLREEEETAATGVKLHDFSFSGNVSYGTAVPRRTRDKSGKVRRVRVCGYSSCFLCCCNS